MGVECRGLCDGFFEVGIAVDTQATPPSCPSLVLVAEKLAYMLNSSVRVSSHSRETCIHVKLLSSQQQRRKNQKKQLSVIVWEPGTGGQDVETRALADAQIWCRWQLMLGLNAVQCTPGAVRCTAPSWTLEVRMQELAACRQVQAVLARQASFWSSDASAMAHSTGSSDAGSGSICFANKAPVPFQQPRENRPHNVRMSDSTRLSKPCSRR